MARKWSNVNLPGALHFVTGNFSIGWFGKNIAGQSLHKKAPTGSKRTTDSV